jgi:hypothetical protein
MRLPRPQAIRLAVTPLRHTGVVPIALPDQTPAEQAFVTEVVRGMAALGGDGPIPEEQVARGDLTLPLGLSAWILRAAIGLPDAYQAMLRLRRAIVDAAGLDLRSEPVPLRVADQRIALCTLGAYLFSLVGRAARHAGMTPVELAEDVLVRLGE